MAKRSRNQIRAIKAKQKKFTFGTDFSVVARNEDEAFETIIDKVSESPTSVFFVKKMKDATQREIEEEGVEEQE